MKYSVSFTVVALAAMLAGPAGCSATISPKAGYFYGINVQKDPRVVFVLDISGSMGASDATFAERMAGKGIVRAVGGAFGRRAGSAADTVRENLEKRVEKAKLHLIAAVAGLPPEATFNVVIFRDRAMRLSPTPLPANAAAKTAIGTFVYLLKEGGSTDMIGGLRDALEMEPTHLILLGDGEPTTSSTEDVLELLRSYNEQPRTMVSTVGVGEGHDRAFMEQIAMEHGGIYVAH